MRNAFASELTAIAKNDPRIVLLSGDIGNKLFDHYKEAAPERFFNCGVAEANLIGVAAGLALNGLRPVAYTITPFITYRCYEQIRVDVCYHNLPVVIVGVGSGLGYASLGATHHSCEDIAVMRALPNMVVLCPGDPLEVRGAVRAALAQNSPVYIRIGKKGEPVIHPAEPAFTIGRAIELTHGTDVCLLAAGTVLGEARTAAEIIRQHGVTVTLTSFPTVKPLDDAYLAEVFRTHRLVVTLEEHSIIGGFGSAVAEWIVDRHERSARLLRLATRDEFFHLAGEQEFAREHFGLNAEAVAARIYEVWRTL